MAIPCVVVHPRFPLVGDVGTPTRKPAQGGERLDHSWAFLLFRAVLHAASGTKTIDRTGDRLTEWARSLPNDAQRFPLINYTVTLLSRRHVRQCFGGLY